MTQPTRSLPCFPLLATLLLPLAACTGSSSGSSSVAPGEEPEIGTILASTAASPALGGLLTVEDEPGLEGTALDVPPFALAEAVTLSIGPPAELPATSPFGQVPVGTPVVIEPGGTSFAEPATLSLPVPPAEASKELYVGRWNPGSHRWEDLGGEVSGDFVTVEIDHLSLYGVFYRGKSLVRVVNQAASPPATSGITLTYIGGPVPPADFDTSEPFPAYLPFPSGGIDFTPGEGRLFSLLPGAYHFAVSYPQPQPGVANSLFFTIPELAEGADDGQVDQTLTITLEGASSTSPETDASIVFPGASQTPASNLPPTVNLDVSAPAGVPVVDALTGGPVTATTRVIDVGPIKVQDLAPFGNLTLLGRAFDAEGHSPIHAAWTWADGTLPTHDFLPNGATMGRGFLPNPLKEGLYTVHFTAYDDFGLWDEGRWNILVEGNEKPTIEVVADDVILDFGRLDSIRESTASCLPAELSVLPPLCTYVDTDMDTVPDTTVLKTYPVVPDPMNPTQDPTSLTCVFAFVYDADGDPLSGGFDLPTPVFGRGNFYAALPVPPSAELPAGIPVGTLIRTKDEMAAYNAQLIVLANLGALPPDPTLFPDYPAGTQALPVIWEAPDDPDAPTNSTNDCSEFGPCQIAKGGTVNVLARITDGYSAEQKDYATLGFPDDDVQSLCKIQSVTPDPPDPAPQQGVTILAKVFPAVAGESVVFAITGTDGYFKTETKTTDSSGCADFFIPGGAEGVKDFVTVDCGDSHVEVTYEF